jgi:Outer membrane protein beta-barrel domain
MLSSPPPHLSALRWASVLVTLLILAAGVPATAQTPAPPDTAAPPAAAAAKPPEPAGPSRLHYGVRFGPSFTSLSSVEPFDDTAAIAAFEPTLNFGGYFEIDLTGAFSFQPEVLFAAKGHRIRDKDAQPFTDSAGQVRLPAADRVVLVRYLEFPMLLRMSRRTHENTSVYLIGGPSFALRRNAVIREVADSGRLEEIGDLVTGSDLSYILGAGLQHRRWLVDARVTRGMRNIASDPFPAGVKTGAFSVLMGARF